jgi:hypothetical protein
VQNRTPFISLLVQEHDRLDFHRNEFPCRGASVRQPPHHHRAVRMGCRPCELARRAHRVTPVLYWLDPCLLIADWSLHGCTTTPPHRGHHAVTTPERATPPGRRGVSGPRSRLVPWQSRVVPVSAWVTNGLAFGISP